MIIAILAVLLALFTSDAEATQEARCTDLGANCLCSEPLQMTGFAQDTNWFNPNDSTTKQCQSNVALGYSIAHGNTVPPLVGTDAAALAALPTGHQVQRFLRYPEGDAGGRQIDHMNISGNNPFTGQPRVAVRFYRYWSPNYEFKGDHGGLCTNSMKYFIPYPDGGQWDTNAGANSAWIFYGVGASIGGVDPPGGWDCCSIPPGADPGTPMGIVTGRWYRIEVVLRQWSDSSHTTRMEGYRKDVTTNGPNYKFIDSFVACQNCGTIGAPFGEDWPGGAMQMHGPLRQIEINMFRAGTCNGWIGLSHALVAAWGTDAGQFIGAASEIEGGAGPTPPIAPTNLRIFSSMQRLLGLLWAAVR